jgi:acetyltransferase-like isoleucine patch superfamily enzyme
VIPVHKTRLTRGQRLRRLVLATFDPRAWAHAAKVVNYFNYTHVTELRKVTRGRDVVISPMASFANGQNIELRDRVRIGAYCSLWAGPGTGRIVLGDDVMLGPGVMISAANYRFNDGSPVTDQAMNEADIVIGRDVWIAYGAVILAGAAIGEGAIIGAGAVIRGEVAPFAIMAGNPARHVGDRRLPGLPGIA